MRIKRYDTSLFFQNPQQAGKSTTQLQSSKQNWLHRSWFSAFSENTLELNKQRNLILNAPSSFKITKCQSVWQFYNWGVDNSPSKLSHTISPPTDFEYSYSKVNGEYETESKSQVGKQDSWF